MAACRGIWSFYVLSAPGGGIPRISSARASLALAVSIITVTLGTTVINQVLLLVLHWKIHLVHEPRAFQFIYIPFYLSLGYLLQKIWSERRRWFWQWKTLAIMCIIGIVAGAGLVGIHAVSTISRLLLNKKEFSTGDTCRLPIYGWIEKNTKQNDLFLIDPNMYPPFRICAKRSIVYTYRDTASALRTNYLVEWARRKEIVERAYAEGSSKLLETAREFGADYIVSQRCVAVPCIRKIYQDSVYQEDCIYKVPAIAGK